MACTTTGEAPPRPPASTPPPGAYRVGFRSWWEFDATRSYDMVFADGSRYAEPGREGSEARPILVNLWYPASPPADASTMNLGRYLVLPRAPAEHGTRGLERFVCELERYEERIAAEQVFGRPVDELDADAKAGFAAFLATPTICVRDAPAAAGRFPLVLYHGGYGSSVEDQSLLCEWLASCGYVVVGSAYVQGDGASLDVDAHDASLADFEFLVRCAAGWGGIDATRVAAIGHSGGAHAVLRWSASSTCPARAIVSLDTTQDYYSVRDPRWKDLIEPLSAHSERVTCALLAAASPWASYELIDSLAAADRWYFTAPLEHDEFISQGIERLDHASEHPELAARTRAAYVDLCRFVRAFLDAHLGDDRAQLEALARAWTPLTADGAVPHVEHAPRGATGPEPYVLGSAQPPRPRQLRPLLLAAGREATLATLRRAHARAPGHPIFSTQLMYGWCFELVAESKLEDARALHALYGELVPGYEEGFLGLCEFAELFGTEFARASWRTLLALEPENSAARERLARLEAGKP